MTVSRRPLRVLHTADIHLDSDGYGNAVERAAHRERERLLFRRIVDGALSERVDLLLIAGDLFDHNRVPDETVEFARRELDRLENPVIIIPGNHDCLRTNAIYDRHHFSTGADHIRVISRLQGQTIEFPELDTVIWGRAMEEHEPGFSPLAGIPSRDDRRWNIAMGHGFFYDERQRPDRSSPIFAEEIRDAGWDYFALGHHHSRTDVSQDRAAAHYAGAPTLDGQGAVLRVDLTSAADVRVSVVRL